jgi:hypothetical protein
MKAIHKLTKKYPFLNYHVRLVINNATAIDLFNGTFNNDNADVLENSVASSYLPIKEIVSKTKENTYRLSSLEDVYLTYDIVFQIPNGSQLCIDISNICSENFILGDFMDLIENKFLEFFSQNG